MALGRAQDVPSNCEHKGNLLCQKQPVKPTLSVKHTSVTDGYVLLRVVLVVEQAAVIAGGVDADLGVQTPRPLL